MPSLDEAAAHEELVRHVERLDLCIQFTESALRQFRAAREGRLLMTGDRRRAIAAGLRDLESLVMKSL